MACCPLSAPCLFQVEREGSWLARAMPQRVPERIVYDSVRDMPWMRSAPSPTSQAGWSIQFDRCTHPETPLIRCQAHLIRVRCLCLQARLGC